MNTTINQTVTNTLNGSLKYYTTCFEEYQAIKECLTPFDGNHITVRLQKKLPPTMKLEIESNGVFIRFLATGNTHKIATAKDKYINISNLEQLDLTNFHAGEEIEKLKHILNNPKKLEELIQCWEYISDGYTKMKKAYADLYKNNWASFYNPAHGTIGTNLNIPDDILQQLD